MQPVGQASLKPLRFHGGECRSFVMFALRRQTPPSKEDEYEEERCLARCHSFYDTEQLFFVKVNKIPLSLARFA